MVDREVIIEYGGEAEAGASIGARAASAMPVFTDEALEKGLGAKVNRQIEDAVKNVIRAREELEAAKPEDREPLPRPGAEPQSIGLADVD